MSKCQARERCDGGELSGQRQRGEMIQHQVLKCRYLEQSRRARQLSRESGTTALAVGLEDTDYGMHHVLILSFKLFLAAF